jgi:HPr kinase/phosphorylase
MNGLRIQAVLVAVGGVGVLIQGPPGSGKSLTALHLMSKGHRLVSDDLVEIFLCASGKLMGKSVEEKVRIEVKGLGIFQAQTLFDDATTPCSSVDLAVELDAYNPRKDAGRMEPEADVLHLLGCNVPKVRLPLTRGADPALLVELLARIYKSRGTVHV